MYLSVIIPAYNEEKRLPQTLSKVRDYLDRQSYDWEVLVVNDGSKDRTAEVVSESIKGWNDALGTSRSLSATHSNPVSNFVRDAGTSLGDIPSGSFRLIDNKVNKGKGGVVKQGMLQAKGEWRLFMDADNSTNLEEIEKLWSFKENFGIIIGSRYLNKDSIKVKQPLIRRIVSRFGNFLIRILLGINMADTQCGFKLFSAKAAEEIFPLQTIMRWGFDMEILAIARKKGYKIKEVAVDWYDAEGSTVKKSAALKILKELFTIKWNLIKGEY
ncbi:MAG: glycosyl transferase family protein [Candidatus Berkelbacteria bacterium]|nr:glycosyl transferase family protein [Candidatus Berkelbacteria bacterium]